jgi:hypothetical protein
MIPKTNVNHATILVPHVNVQTILVVLHVQETFTILTTMVIKLTDNVFLLVQKDIMLTQLPTLVTYVTRVVQNVKDHPMTIVHIVIQLTCNLAHVYTHAPLEPGPTM